MIQRNQGSSYIENGQLEPNDHVRMRGLVRSLERCGKCVVKNVQKVGFCLKIVSKESESSHSTVQKSQNDSNQEEEDATDDSDSDEEDRVPVLRTVLLCILELFSMDLLEFSTGDGVLEIWRQVDLGVEEWIWNWSRDCKCKMKKKTDEMSKSDFLLLEESYKNITSIFNHYGPIDKCLEWRSAGLQEDFNFEYFCPNDLCPSHFLGKNLQRSRIISRGGVWFPEDFIENLPKTENLWFMIESGPDSTDCSVCHEKLKCSDSEKMKNWSAGNFVLGFNDCSFRFLLVLVKDWKKTEDDGGMNKKMRGRYSSHRVGKWHSTSHDSDGYRMYNHSSLKDIVKTEFQDLNSEKMEFVLPFEESPVLEIRMESLNSEDYTVFLVVEMLEYFEFVPRSSCYDSLMNDCRKKMHFVDLKIETSL